MVACEIFQYQIISSFGIMNGTSDRTLSQKLANWGGPSKVTFHPNHWTKKLLHLLQLFVLMLSKWNFYCCGTLDLDFSPRWFKIRPLNWTSIWVAFLQGVIVWFKSTIWSQTRQINKHLINGTFNIGCNLIRDSG